MLLRWLIYFGLLSLMICGPSVIYKSKNIECITKPKFVANVSCYIKALNWNKAVAQMDCELLKPLRNASVHIQIFKKDYSNKYQPFLVDIVVNMCDVISKKNFLSYGTIFLKVLTQYTNVNHSCPLQVYSYEIRGHLYARGLYLDENLVPDFPLGFYQIVIEIYENYAKKPSEEYGTVKFNVEAMERVKMRSKKPSKIKPPTIV